MSGARLLALCLVLAGLAAPDTALTAKPPAGSSDPPPSAVGAGIYLNGILASGASLTAGRDNSEPVTGERAACVNCHRRSGLGAKEARSIIPPITGQYLFHPKATGTEDSQLPYVPGERLEREPYTDATLARAIREGIDSEGHHLNYLMPHYALDDADMAALIAHLRSLDHSKVPGVSAEELHFATIITPDADPVKKRGVVDVLQHFFADRNRGLRGPGAQTMVTSGHTAIVRSMFKVNRVWVLHIWELSGPPSGWQAQLDKKFSAEPVFAVLSGLSGPDWSPVSGFCERQSVPCLFPNVEAPPAGAEQEFHSLYFSRGVRLEADLIATALKGRFSGQSRFTADVLYRAGDVGEAAAPALSAQLQAAGGSVSIHVIPRGAAVSAVTSALRTHSRADATVLWLRASDLAALNALPPPMTPVYISGLMSGLEAAPLPAAWKSVVHMAYPVDLEERRRVRVDYAMSWFRIRNIPVVAQQVQVDTYLACGLLTETVKHMVDAFVPDYLVERLEDTVEHRIITGYYPRLTLGPHQRFASKGGFIVHADPASNRFVPEGDWLTP